MVVHKPGKAALITPLAVCPILVPVVKSPLKGPKRDHFFSKKGPKRDPFLSKKGPFEPLKVKATAINNKWTYCDVDPRTCDKKKIRETHRTIETRQRDKLILINSIFHSPWLKKILKLTF